jgi:hydrogenase maturation protease
VLLGDDGFGPLAVELFRCEYECGPNVDILDLGTPGLDLAPYLCGADVVVIVDAIEAPEKPGTVCVYSESDLLARRAQLRLTGHDPALEQCLAQLELTDQAPSEVIVIGAVPESCSLGARLSASVLSASSVAVDKIAEFLAERGTECHRRRAPLRPNVWWLGNC